MKNKSLKNNYNKNTYALIMQLAIIKKTKPKK